MYDKETRFKLPLWTPPGPGNYELSVDTSFPESPSDYTAPFLTSSDRFKRKKQVDNVAPNFYTIKNEIGNKSGGYFWLSTSRRFEEPAKIKPRKKGECNFRLGNGTSRVSAQSLRSIRKSLRCPKIKTKPTPPSIPDKKSSNGYEFNPDGTIYKVIPDENDTTLGPAFYNVPMGESCLTTLLYKGNFWSHSYTLRSPSNESGPGPADYNIQTITKKDLLHFPVNELKIPRLLDEIEYNEMKQDTPGPAGYVIPDPFRIKLIDLCCNKAPFATSAPRFLDNDPKLGPYIASPSTYNCDFQNSSLAPFGTTTPRFKHTKSDQNPEPNRYYIRGFADELKYKTFQTNVLARTGPVPFGSNTVRMKPSGNLDTIYLKPQKKKIVLDLSTKSIEKKSKPNLTKRLIPSKVVYPAPGDHEVARVMLYLRQKTSHRKPPQRKADPAAFLVSSKRFSDTEMQSKFDHCKHPRKYSTPGPGAYNLEDSKPCPKQGISFTKQNRFPKTRFIRWPSPASYKPASSYLHTVLKPTYNTTLHSTLPRNYGAKWRPSQAKNKFIVNSNINPGQFL